MAKAKTNKTPQLMRLLKKEGGGGKAENPILNEEFKKEVIVKPPEPPRSWTPAMLMGDSPEEGINVAAALVQEWLPKAIRRFHCCSCDLCVAELMVRCLKSVPTHYVPVRPGNQEDLALMESEKERLRPDILRHMVRFMMEARWNPPHNRKGRLAQEPVGTRSAAQVESQPTPLEERQEPPRGREEGKRLDRRRQKDSERTQDGPQEARKERGSKNRRQESIAGL